MVVKRAEPLQAAAPPAEREERPVAIIPALRTMFAYMVLTLFGKIRDLFGRITGRSRYITPGREGYAPLLSDFDDFFTRRFYHRVQDCWNRPIVGAPKARATHVVRRSTADGNRTHQLHPEDTTKCINLGSYNYLGFADDWQETCREQVVEALERFGTCTASAATDAGTTALHRELERTVAAFTGKEDAVVFPMGYGTNCSAIPSLLGAGTLLVSDSLNHTSIVNGARASGATIRVFKHNDVAHLDDVLRQAHVDGQPKSSAPWRKIVVLVEGIYSMEGEIVDLRGVLDVSHKYKAYVYLDEAHSIGALGATGRGACEHCGVDPSEVDVLMGTFTKSFGAMGGYIAASREFVGYLRHHSPSALYAAHMSPVVAAQVLRAFEIISGADGSDTGALKLASIRDNANYFRRRLEAMGYDVYGDYGSPIVPVMLYHPCKVTAFSRLALERGLAVVVVGFPATPLLLARARFCISAGHDVDELDEALNVLQGVLEDTRVHKPGVASPGLTA